MLSGSELPAIEVEDLAIRFRTTAEKKPTLKRRINDLKAKRRPMQTIEAVHNVSFEVPTGCFYGIIGRNGAGKSTLMKAIAGIITPAEGRITVYGRTTLLRFGVGFNRELTGRQNIMVGGLAAGLDPEYIREHIEEIIAFADIGAAIDYPMRTYSSGMGGRVAFAVSAHLDPDILLIDEALAAGGDARFKAKASNRIKELMEGEATVVFVSHGLSALKDLADQVLWIEGGVVFDEGPAEEVIDEYLAHEGVMDTGPVMDDV